MNAIPLIATLFKRYISFFNKQYMMDVLLLPRIENHGTQSDRVTIANSYICCSRKIQNPTFSFLYTADMELRYLLC